MLARVQDYSDNQLEAIGNANVDFDPAAGDSLEGTTDDFQDFVADLRSCLDGSSSDRSVAETSTPGDAAATTEPSETTDA